MKYLTMIQETSFYSDVEGFCRINEIIANISLHLPTIDLLRKENILLKNDGWFPLRSG